MKTPKKDSAPYVLGVAALWVFYAFVGTMLFAACDDGRHSKPRVCKTVVQAACVPTGGTVRCGLLASDGARYNGLFHYPAMVGDRVCNEVSPFWDGSGTWSEP